LLDTVLNTRVSAIATSITQPACAGQSTGAIALSAFNGVAPYAYTWNTGATGSTLSNVPPAVYLVTITDATSCSATAQFTVAPNSGWGYFFYLQGSSSNCSNNATITTQVTGSNPPFTYNWSNNATTQNLASLAAGIYSLTVTDAAGCTVAGSTTIPLECYSTIGGIVFNDLNSNCQPDSGETRVPNVCLVAFNNTDTYFGYTNAQGQYRILVNGGGTFTLSAGYNYGTCGEMLLCNNAGNTVTIAVPGDTLLQNNFAVSGNPAFDLGLRSTWSAGNPGFTKTYHIHYGNQSYNVFNGQATVSFAYDTGLVYQSSNPPATNHNLATHTLTWSVDSVSSLYGIWGDEIISADFLVPIGTPLGQHVTSTFSIDPTSGDCDVTNNSYTTSDLVTGSYDPNEKIVEPAGAITEADSILTYTIGFQNTGTDSTHFIILKDTLSENLDVSSVRNIASSHAYTEFNISGKGILTWTFNPLRLVDSFTNEPESHGFVKFTIKKKPNLPLGTAISNKAYIYFDYNPAVITNLVENTLTDPTYIFEAADQAGLVVNAFPNPFTDVVNIVIEGPEGNFGFELFDVAGHAMRKPEAIKNNRFVLQRNALAAGVYFYKITAPGNAATGHGKLIVK
nr:T9SS type A sorting domain-containing protein [Chitinophagales bacterium]